MTRVMILALSKHLSMEIDVHSILSVGWACGKLSSFCGNANDLCGNAIGTGDNHSLLKAFLFVCTWVA